MYTDRVSKIFPLFRLSIRKQNKNLIFVETSEREGAGSEVETTDDFMMLTGH